MDLGSFISALLAIVVIDIVLAGDNAIVIALAARGLPDHLRKRAIIWGAAGAIAVRTLMTMIVVWLLKIPGLLFAGGALLVWIAYRLLLPSDSEGEDHGPAATTFWAAMRTIVIADAAMGLDNVLAVAGAAHGSYLLVALGLLISVPIVVWGSTIVLKVVDRYPSVVYLGSGVLVFTAAKMMSSEPLIAPAFAAAPWLKPLLFLMVPLVLWICFVKNHRRLASRIHARLAAFGPLLPGQASSQAIGDAMLKVLIPVDGSGNALRAVRHALAEYRRNRELELHLLNVQPRLYRHIARFVSRRDRDGWRQQRHDEALAGARAVLSEAGVPHQAHQATGDRAEQICRTAEQLGVHHILMGTARKNSLTRMLEDSVTEQVLQATPVPVEVIAGDAVSKWERWALPAGALGIGGLLWLAAE